LKEIASAVGTPIDIDGPTRNRTFGHYARILVDIDLSKKAYDEVLVERDDFAFMVEIQYEQRPLFCHHCYSIGHNITTCRWLNPQAAKENVNRGKQPVNKPFVAPPKAPQHKDGGASTSAIGGNGSWIPISVNSTITTTTTTTVSDPHTTKTTSIPVNTLTHQTLREVLENPTVSDVTNSLLDSVKHNHVSQREMVESPNSSIERVTHSSPLGREDLRPDEVEQTTQTSREELEIPTVDDVSELLQDGVEHDHVSPRELVESPKGARESVIRPSPMEHDDTHEVSADFQDHQEISAHPIDPIVTLENSDGSLDGTNNVLAGSNNLKTPLDAEASRVVDGGKHTTQAQKVIILQRQEVHPSKNVQHGLDLWERVREYDVRSAAEATDGFMLVLTRNQKQKLKVQHCWNKWCFSKSPLEF